MVYGALPPTAMPPAQPAAPQPAAPRPAAPRRPRQRSPWYLGLGALCLAGLSVARRQQAPPLVESLEGGAGAGAPLDWIVYNKYTLMTPIPSVYPWKRIAEPHRDHRLVVLGADEDRYAYTWRVERTNTYRDVNGANVSHVFDAVGIWRARVTEAPRSGSAASVVSAGEIMVKYVRREIRSLDDEDREAFFGALRVVYTVPTRDGQQQFGSDYSDIAFFSRMHLLGAADRSCDHWHDDAGLMTHHMSFTLLLERSLQAVNPMVSVPYWDYSRDAYEYGPNWRESVVFNESWFGGTKSQNASLNVIDAGAWAWTGVLADARDFSNITNPYGILRSPWNANPHPYVTRADNVFGYQAAGYTTFPGCNEMHACFKHDRLSDMNECLNGYTHGPVHIMLGGQWNVGAEASATINDYHSNRLQLLLFKVLWRMGYADCPTDCSSDAQADCRCSCSKDKRGDLDLTEIMANVTGVFHWVDAVSDRIFYENASWHIRDEGGGASPKAMEDLFDTFCDPGWVGELYTSNAPADPIFWPIHTTADRLLSWKRILAHKGKTLFNQTWGYAHPSATPSDTGKVCDWLAKDEAMDLPECRVETCEGHNAEDLLPGMPEYTNAEFYDFMDPYNDDLPYLYENFDWDHCDKLNFTFSAADYPTSFREHEAGGEVSGKPH